MEALWPLISQGGATGLLAVFVVAILTGRLVPSSTIASVKEDRDQWRLTALEREKTLTTVLESMRESNQATQMVVELVEELRERSGR